MSLASANTTSPVVDSIYTRPSTSLAAAASGIHAILQRAHSMGYQHGSQHFKSDDPADQGGHRDRCARERTHSPVRANSKRRRSVASISRPEKGVRHASEFSYSSPRSVSIELGSDNYPDDSSRVESCPRSQSRPASGHRSPSRGRTRRRKDSVHYSYPRQDNDRQNDTRSNISRPRQYKPVEVPTSGGKYHPSPPNSHDTANSGSSYVTKGVFRLYNYQEPEGFRPLKSISQPEQTWRAGDGFSDDEATPDFVFLMTGKHKRKRSRSLSAFGQLSIEAGNVAENGKMGVTSSQPHRLRGLQRNVRRKTVKDLWPTRDNFSEDLVVQKPGAVAIKDGNIVQSTPLFSPTPMPSSTLEMKQAKLQKRRASDFENFRRKRRSQSRRDDENSVVFPTASPEHRYQSSDDGYNEEEGGFCGQERDESEGEQQSATDQQLQYVPGTACNFESSDIDSEMLSEYDGLEDMIRNIVPDSQPGEVSRE